MKKLILAIGIIGILALYVFSQKNETGNVPLSVPPQPSAGSSSSNSPTMSSSSGSTSYKDGTYQGDVADAFYGNVQVQVQIQGGKITDVQFLQYPNSPGHSSEVSSFALPALKQETIQAQSANVDAVSGATQTSQAFIQSLQSALQKAQS